LEVSRVFSSSPSRDIATFVVVRMRTLTVSHFSKTAIKTAENLVILRKCHRVCTRESSPVIKGRRPPNRAMMKWLLLLVKFVLSSYKTDETWTVVFPPYTGLRAFFRQPVSPDSDGLFRLTTLEDPDAMPYLNIINDALSKLASESKKYLYITIKEYDDTVNHYRRLWGSTHIDGCQLCRGDINHCRIDEMGQLHNGIFLANSVPNSCGIFDVILEYPEKLGNDESLAYYKRKTEELPEILMNSNQWYWITSGTPHTTRPFTGPRQMIRIFLTDFP
jgi:hypothetical protein